MAVVALSVGIAPTQAMAADEALDENTFVTSVENNADGTVTETIYSPAPDVTLSQLALNLAASGVTGVTLKREGDVTATVAACSNGSARTWPSNATCFVKWSKNTAVRPIIDFVDHSSSSWPVGRAVTNWNATSGIDSIYRPASSGCDGAPVHCVNVYSKNYGGTGWVGRTSRTFNSAETYYASAKVELNDYYGGTETEKWSTSCHELGHVLGLGHNTSTSSCLYYARVAGRSKSPLANDIALLERYY